MLVSYMLRLRTEGLRYGSFAGEVEAVASGHRMALASVEQLLAFVAETGDEEAARTEASLALGDDVPSAPKEHAEPAEESEASVDDR